MVYTFRKEDLFFLSERIKGYIRNGNKSVSKSGENTQSMLCCQSNIWLPRSWLWIQVSRKLSGMHMSPATSLKSLTYKAPKSSFIYTKQCIWLPQCNHDTVEMTYTPWYRGPGVTLHLSFKQMWRSNNSVRRNLDRYMCRTSCRNGAVWLENTCFSISVLGNLYLIYMFRASFPNIFSKHL